MTSDPISGAGTPNRVSDMSGAGFAPSSSINPENIMFSAMMSRSQEMANLMNSYYEGIQTENQQMAQYNDLMSVLDNAEAIASANGPNGPVELDNSTIVELNAMGISVPDPLNSTTVAQLNDAVKNQVTNLSTQSETDMDQLQELSNNYNTVSQEISSFIASITQTNQQISSNLK